MTEISQSPQRPTPDETPSLFRSEAMAAQERVFGDVIRMQSFSLLWIYVVLLAFAFSLACGLLATYEKTLSIDTVVVQNAQNNRSAALWLRLEGSPSMVRGLPVHSGMHILLQCSNCPEEHLPKAGVISQIVRPVPPSTRSMTIAIALSSDAQTQVLDQFEQQAGHKVRMTVRLGRKRLCQRLADWLNTKTGFNHVR